MTTTQAMAAPPTSTPAPGKVATICHIFSGDLWAGAEVMIFNLLSSLARDPGLRLIALSLNEGPLTERLRREGITTYVIPEARHTFIGILWRAVRLLRREQVAVLHSHRYKEDVLAWLLARCLAVPTLVATMHGLPEVPTSSARHAVAGRLRTALDFFVLRRNFAATVAVSHDMKRVLLARYAFRPERVRVVHNGGRFPLASVGPNGKAAACFHIGTVGRLVPIKGLDLFLDVAGALKRHLPSVRFSILGEGPLREELRRKAADLSIDDCVDFCPPRPDPFPYYHSLDLYLNTSVHEGLPLSVIEAMGCGKPVVSAAVGGIREIVAHGEHGLLVEGRDPAAFVQSCLTLIEDDRLRAAMGERAAAAAQRQWSADVMAGGYRELYQDCVTASAKGPGRRGAWDRVASRLRQHGRRLVERLDRRRALALRRNPAPVVRALGKARRVLVLCQGNVIRSAFAERLLSTAVEGRQDVTIRSAGLATQAGWRAHPRVIARGAAMNLDFTRHAANPVTPAMMAAADVVFVMEVSQLTAVTRRFLGARRRTFLLTSLAPDVPMDIPDPAGRDDSTVDACLEHVARAVKPLAAVLAAR